MGAYAPSKVVDGAMEMGAPTLTGVPYGDAYRYMDWLLTVPLLLIEILLVMKLAPAEFSSKAKTLGVGSALMIASGYYGELVVTGNLAPRWMCWFISMLFFLYPMFGIAGPTAVVMIQIGYSISDIISKCGVGLVIYQISAAKTKIEQEEGLVANKMGV